MPAQTTLVGREAELARLTGWVDDAVSGTGRAVFVEGEPGIGKSSLVRAACSLAEQRGCRVYWAAADELGQALPLQPLLDALGARSSPNEPRLSTILRLLQGEVDSAADPTTAAAEQMLTLLADLCSAAPTVLVVDDLQWADRTTIDVWEWLARSVDRSALLLIGVARPVPQRDEVFAVRRAVGQDAVVQLGSLPDTAVTALVASISDGDPGEKLLRLVRETAGNPLYLTELMDALVRSRRLKVSETGFVEVIDGPVPSTLLGAIAHRLDFLRRDVRIVLQAAAMLGTEFLVSDLAVVVGRRISELVAPIDEALASGVLRDVGERLVFRHPLIRTALYDDIPSAVRPAWHLEAARTLAEAGVAHHRVARQLLQAVSAPGAGQLDDTLLDWLTDAAPTLATQAPRTAIELLRQACRRSPPTTKRGAVLVCQLADALVRAGERAEAEQVASRAMTMVTDPGTLVDLHSTVSQCRRMDGRTDESLESLADALERPDLPARERARLLVLIARAQRDLGEVTIAGDVAGEALVIAEDVGDSWAVAWSLHVLTIVSIMRGDVVAALPSFDRALKVVEGDTTLIDIGLLLQVNQAIALGDLDRYTEALRVVAQVRERADDDGSLVRLAQAQSALGELLFEVGRWDDALAEVEALPDEFKDPSVICCDRGTAATIAFHRGDTDTARKHLTLAAPSSEMIGNRVVASLALARSLAHELAGAPGAALAVLTAGVTGTEELDETEDLLPEVSRLAARVGNASVSADMAAQTEALDQRSSVPHRRAAAAYSRGLRDDDPSLLRVAAGHYDEASRPLLRAKALEAAALGYARQGDRAAARTAFTQADDLYDQLGANWDLTHLRARLRHYGIRRGSRSKHRQVRTGWNSLTPTETRIAGLVATGLSNRQIAGQLVLSTRTVETHVSHILGKLAVRSRVDIAREAGSRDRHRTPSTG
ncbi:MAG TPA: AAA family ATPase [Actinophytocola sp.]|jgi:DNA-binding CsgD family transcriptional regulator|nr:AAA family ATPase [Actinophytocola sp.]